MAQLRTLCILYHIHVFSQYFAATHLGIITPMSLTGQIRVVVLVFALTAFVTPSFAHASLSPEVVARAVQAFFPHAPEMVAIARCESGLRQYDAMGTTLRGGWANKMIGLFQLHETYHRAAARALGYDIDTLLGNILYAKTLYASEGTTPWNSSAHCWKGVENLKTEKLETSENYAAATSAQSQIVSTLLTKTLTYGMTDPEVRVLQRLLGRAGYRVTSEGAETDYFGTATYKALLKFQCEKNIACLTKPELRAGAGTTGPKTRAALNQY